MASQVAKSCQSTSETRSQGCRRGGVGDGNGQLKECRPRERLSHGWKLYMVKVAKTRRMMSMQIGSFMATRPKGRKVCVRAGGRVLPLHSREQITPIAFLTCTLDMSERTKWECGECIDIQRLWQRAD
jgi:hypothetical protein